ncbi:hypothetical protein FACS18945_3090 [Bacteroidia bacterium]|nr:hypothetical protein FACS18945_3090 [Bacteroidia bacterium]
MNKNILLLIAGLCLCLSSCRKDEEILPPEVIVVEPSDTLVAQSKLIGFYLLNEGNMGSNKSTLDYYDYATKEYSRNIFAFANPTVPKELGDVGNDLQIYGSKLYAVINCSNKIEVMDKYTAKRLGQINIPNCRYIRFHEGYAYVTSYAGPVEINPDYEQKGYVAKVDTATFQVLDRCIVGFQPDELEIVGGKIYVANSGGYMVPNYESTVSVIDIQSFTETKRIEVAINLHHLRADKHGTLWVSSRGDYYDVPSRLYWIDTQTDTYGGELPVAVSEMTLDGDSLYLYSTEFSYNSMDWDITFGIVDVAKKQIVTRNFIADGEEKKISMPYGIMVNPVTKDIYITDAANYVYPGALICFDRYGKKKWQVQTGDIPAHFALLWE